MVPKKKISKDDAAFLKKTASSLLKYKEKMDSILEGMQGVPMRVDRLDVVCLKLRDISNEMEFCVSKIGDVIEKDSEKDSE